MLDWALIRLWDVSILCEYLSFNASLDNSFAVLSLCSTEALLSLQKITLKNSFLEDFRGILDKIVWKSLFSLTN